MCPDLLTVPPGFDKGMTFDTATKKTLAAEQPPPQTVSMSELLGGGDMMAWALGREDEEDKNLEGTEATQQVRPYSVPVTYFFIPQYSCVPTD